MLRLRPYKPCDANTIVTWIHNQREFRLWSSDRYDHFPLAPSDINNKYYDWNGDCVESDNFYPMTAFDDSGIIGHLILRYINGDKQILRIGWVIVDDQQRGKGYGKEMLKLTIDYAFNILKVNKITIGVFDSNMPAYYCYLSVGFKDIQVDTVESYYFNDEKWTVLELELTRQEYETRNSRSSFFSESKPKTNKPKLISSN